MSKGRDEFLQWLREIERKWQARWRAARAFEADPRPGVPKYFMTVPYPYTNGPLHIGHGRTYTIGDIVARYKRLRGYNVLYPMAFHITGTPIIAISEMIARGDEKTIERYRSYVSMYVEDNVDEIVKGFSDPLRLATFFAERVQADFEALGFGIDWRRKFHTGEPIYNKFVTWQFLRMAEKGLIERGEHIVTYCLLHKQPEGEDDIEDADVNPVEILEFTAIKFRLEDGTVLLAATLRPETIYGVTNLWVRPDAKYVMARMGQERVIVSEKGLTKLVHQHPEKEIEALEVLEGSRLVGKFAVSPLGRRVPILPAEFVDPDNATGIVYSEPSDAPYDYVALMELKSDPSKLAKYGLDPGFLAKVEPIKIIEVPEIQGHHAAVAVEREGITSQLDPRLEELSREVYREQYYRGVMAVDDPLVKGRSVREAREIVREELERRGEAFPFYELNRKARCRAGGEIIVAKIVDQWFINYGKDWLKEEARNYVENAMKFVPEKYRKAFVDAIEWVGRRPCARRRGIGTKLPFDEGWIIESLSDSTIYMAFYTIVHMIRDGVRPEQLTPELFDYVFLGRGDPDKISEETGIPLEKIKRMRAEFEYWYPVDHRHTATPHISNHLTFFIMTHLALFDRDKWPRLISLNEPVIREGAKMSKSKGNVIMLRDIADRYSADLFRLYISSAASLDAILDWREAEVSQVLDSLARFVNFARAAAAAKCEEARNRGIAERRFLSEFNRVIEEATRSAEALEIRDYVQAAFFKALSLVEELRAAVGEGYVCALREVIDDWLRLLNPIIPHVTEEIWEWLGHEGFLSTDRWPAPVPGREDPRAVALYNYVERIVEDVKNVAGAAGRRPSRINVVVASKWKRELIGALAAGADVRQAIEVARERLGMRGREKEVVQFVEEYRRRREASELSQEDELNAIRELSNLIKLRTGADEIVAMTEEEAKGLGVPRAERAYPGRPALFIEFSEK
ncbi:MAG: leucine--tRNA ligase [Desulfurococcaceae archaeon]